MHLGDAHAPADLGLAEFLDEAQANDRALARGEVLQRGGEGRVELDQLVALVLAAEGVEVGGASVAIVARGSGPARRVLAGRRPGRRVARRGPARGGARDTRRARGRWVRGHVHWSAAPGRCLPQAHALADRVARARPSWSHENNAVTHRGSWARQMPRRRPRARDRSARALSVDRDRQPAEGPQMARRYGRSVLPDCGRGACIAGSAARGRHDRRHAASARATPANRPSGGSHHAVGGAQSQMLRPSRLPPFTDHLTWSFGLLTQPLRYANRLSPTGLGTQTGSLRHLS